MHQRQRMSFVMKKRFKRTLMEEYVGVILDVSFVKSSFGDEFNGKYVRPSWPKTTVDRQSQELLQRRLTLSKPESPQVLNKLDRFDTIMFDGAGPQRLEATGDYMNKANFIEAALSWRNQGEGFGRRRVKLGVAWN